MEQNTKPITLYTIGFVQKNAKDFFSLLKTHKVKTLIDIRLNNASQLAGFTKKEDLKYFLKEICNIEYKHRVDFAPTKDLLDAYKNKQINWLQYESQYKELLTQRAVEIKIQYEELDNACFLCSEQTAEKCHRRLLAEYFKTFNRNIIIKHL